jgi:hypothetical protein
MSSKANHAYIRMALGLSWRYTEEVADEEHYRLCSNMPLCQCPKYSPLMVDYVWTHHDLVNEICTAWGISRERFVRSMAAPKPSLIAHQVFNDELEQFYGERLPAWPKGRGLIIPKWKGREIETINFHPLNEILKPRRVLKAA